MKSGYMIFGAEMRPMLKASEPGACGPTRPTLLVVAAATPVPAQI